MATDLENLQTRRSAILAELAALSSSAAGGLPNSLAPTGVDHQGYKEGLYKELAAIDQLLLSEQGAWEVVSESFPG